MVRFKTAVAAFATGLLAVGMPLIPSNSARAEDYESLTLAPGFQPNPAIATGISGGTEITECHTEETNREGLISTFIGSAETPNHVMTLTHSFNNLYISVQSDDDVTLIVDGPNGTTCSDDVDGLMPALTGEWPAGTYKIWVGDFMGNSGGTYPYQLLIEEQ